MGGKSQGFSTFVSIPERGNKDNLQADSVQVSRGNIRGKH